MTLRISAWVLAAVLALPLSVVQAQSQTFYFGGQAITGHDPLGISPFTSLTSFDGWYTFETSTVGQFPRGYDAAYDNAITAASVTIGGLTYTSGPSGSGQIYLENAGIHPEITSDYYQVFVDGLVGPTIGDGSLFPVWSLSVRDVSGTMLSDFNLPTTAPFVTDSGATGFNLVLWDSDRTTMFIAGGALSYHSNTSPVSPIPEPETYAMLLAGLALLGFASRKKRTIAAA